MTIPSMEEVKGWDVDQVQSFLKQTGLSDCCDNLMTKQVDGLALLGMNDAVLQLWSRDMKIMQIKKLSKLVSQLNTTTMSASRISSSPAVLRQRKDRKMSQGSVPASSDNEWGSDFEDAAETVKNATKISAPGVLKATPDKMGKNVKNTKVWSKPQISINQVPRPYKPPNDQNSSSSSEYANVKKASIALNKSAVSDKISKFSLHDEKPTTSKKSETHKVEDTISSIRQVGQSKLLVTTSKPSLTAVDTSKHSPIKVKNSNTLIIKSSHSNSSMTKFEQHNSLIRKAENSYSSTKKVENSISSMKSINNIKSSLNNMNDPKPLLKKDDNSNSFIPAKKLAFRAIKKSSTESLNKELKHNQMNSNGFQTKVETQTVSVINQAKPPLVQNVQNKTRKLSETSKVKSPVATKVELQHASQVPSDKPAFIVHVDRSSEQKDCQVGEKETPVLSKDAEKAPKVANDIKIKNIKTSDTFVKNNTKYATVKTTKISSLDEQKEQPAKASKYPQRALPLTPPEESAKPNGNKIPFSLTPDQSISSLPTIPTHPSHTIWTHFSSSNSLPDTKLDFIAQKNIFIPTNPENQKTNIWSTSAQQETVSPSTTLPSPLSSYPWYQPVDRRRAEQLVKQLNRDGGFVVRDSKHGGADSPYTLTMHNNNKVFNINIRIRPDGMIALGKEKVEENTYPSIVRMVEHHQLEPLKLTAGDSGTEHSKTMLNYWPRKMQL